MSSTTPTVIAGKYEVLGRLGQGGQASVYKVRHLGLGEIRALKLLPDRGTDAIDSVTRFRREGRALARLRHPHIVQVFDLGRDGDHYYLEMEYVDGPNLAQLLKMHGRPPLHDVLEIVRQVASALAYAHGQPYEDTSGTRQVGLVHRDLKPSNVLLREAPPLHAMLADFGLVKLEDTLGHTIVGTMLGTYRYCAPEQLGLKRGREPVPVDVRADVFALGLVLYELLEGRQFQTIPTTP
jgi:eukaryotic-like serine/threonine-protein kinase